MKKARVAELKNGLSRYLAYVKRGGTVLVFERDRPVARLVPMTVSSGRGDHRLDELERQGLIRRGRGGVPDLLRRPPIRVKGSVLKDLLAERRSGW